MSTIIRRSGSEVLQTPVLNSVLRFMIAPLVDQWFLRAGHAFCRVYRTFDAAQRALPAGRTQGYDNSAAASYYRERLERVYPADYPVLFWLSHCLPLARVFDLGGHVGVAFRAYRRYLPVESTEEWLVCDVPAVCDAGRELAKEWQTANLHFTSDRTAGSGSELFFASGSLQYLEVGLHDILSGLSARPRHVLVNQLPVSEHSTYYTTQSIGVSFCPYRIQSGPELLAGMAVLGYELVDRWHNAEKNCWIPLYPQHSLDHYEGFYFRQAQEI